MRKPYLMLLISLIVTGIIFTGCSQEFPVVSSVYISSYSPKINDAPALSVDGSYVVSRDFRQIDLKSGEETNPYNEYISPEWKFDNFVNLLQWSPDGSQLAFATNKLDSLLGFDNTFYVYYINSHNLVEHHKIGTFYQWSPFGGRLLAKPVKSPSSSWQIYDLESQEFIPITHQKIDIAKEKKLKGSGLFLWSGEANVPIAEIFQINPINFDNQKKPQEIGITILFGDKNGAIDIDYGSYAQIFLSTPPDNIVDAKFDPSGKFILVAQWKCASTDIRQCSLFPGEEYYKSIVDTSLTLVDWRTGDNKELIRISQIDPKNVIALNVEWSADGSTIFISRLNANPIVIKLK
jgi:dipeptidyl aminopeptidase/acylaminoacyl peptidase